jgi:NADH:ubiquinone reductase (H+-translocating)
MTKSRRDGNSAGETYLSGPARARIVIVGCGFGGLFAAKALRSAPAEVLVIDRNNYHLFQPLLYQVACAALTPADIAAPIRTILRHQKNARVMLAEVTRIDLAGRGVYAGEHHLPYDYLVLAPGAVDNYFGHEEWRELAPGMKQVEEATFIRSRLLRSFEAAEIEDDPGKRAAELTFIIVGAGPTGVELAGAIKELAVDVIPRDYRVADTRHARVVLIEAGPRVLPGLHPDSSARALAQLHALGVEVRLGAPVTAVFADGVAAGGERLRSYNVTWTAGVRAAPLTATLGVPLDASGRVRVLPDCSLPHHPEVFVIGDAAWLIDPRSGAPVPGVSQGALQMGRYVARVIASELRAQGGRARAVPFRYHDYGSMATVGKSRAVVEIGRLRFGGLIAWLAWMALHITVLIGFRNRLAVLGSWIYSYVFFRRGSRLITRPLQTAALPPVADHALPPTEAQPVHPAAGEHAP